MKSFNEDFSCLKKQVATYILEIESDHQGHKYSAMHMQFL